MPLLHALSLVNLRGPLPDGNFVFFQCNKFRGILGNCYLKNREESGESPGSATAYVIMLFTDLLYL